MDENHINWTSRIREDVDEAYDMHIPPDIIFKIEENGSIYKISAHKIFMGYASRVFHRMFFVADTQDRNAHELLVKETTGQAFQIMKDGIYNTKPIKEALIGKSVHEVFAVLRLVTRYEIPELELSVKDYLANFPLTEENVLDVAEDAMHYAGTFEDEAQALLITCSKFLKPMFTDAQSVFEYVAGNEDHNEVFLKLMALMNDLPPAPTPKCLNCQQDICLNGRGIQNNQFRVGLIVTNSWAWGCPESGLGKGRVTEVNAGGNIVVTENIESGPNGSISSGGRQLMQYSGTPMFLFSCE